MHMEIPRPSRWHRAVIELLGWKIRAHSRLQRQFAADTPDQLVWHRKPLSVFFLYCFVAILVYWAFETPAPGKSVTALAVAAAAITFRGDLRGKEKLAWMLLLCGFLSIELTSINTERTHSEEDRASAREREAKHFQDIADGIKKSITDSDTNFTHLTKASNLQFQATMGQTQKMLGLQKSAIDGLVEQVKYTTGGDSFCVAGIGGITGDEGVASMRQIGKYPLRSVSGWFNDLDQYNDWVIDNPGKSWDQFPGLRSYVLGDIAVDGFRNLGPVKLDLSGRDTFDFSFSALNGYWDERVYARRVNGKWLQATQVFWIDFIHQPTSIWNKPRLIWEKIDPDYPKIDGKPDLTQKPQKAPTKR